MKKGFFVALLMVAVVAMAFPVCAKAPIIQDLPDIVIGDTGDISGVGTTALRLYRYANIFNLSDPAVITTQNGYTLDKLHVFMYRNAATDPVNIAASDATAFVDTLSDAQYNALTASGTGPGAAAEITDSAASFYWLSLMNLTAATGSPASLAAASVATNGQNQDQITAAGAYGATDIVLLAADGDLPTTPSLVAQKALTVYTVLDADDGTSGGFATVLDFTYDGGANENWYYQAVPDSTYPAIPNATDATAGAIGFNASGNPSPAGYSTWFLSDNATNPKFLIPAAGMADRVYRARVNLIGTNATEAASCGYRLSAQSYRGAVWTGVSVFAVGGSEVDVPTASAALEAQIHWAVPTDLNNWADGGIMTTTNWQAGDANAPTDGRNYCLVFDGVDLSGNTGSLFMDSVAIESYARPADKATPDLEWGGTGTAFNNSPNGYVLATSPIAGLALGTGSVTTSGVTLTMGTIAATPGANWIQANQVTTTVAQKYAEVAGDLIRYKLVCSSPAPNSAPNVRFQSQPVNSTTFGGDQTIWYDNYGPQGIRDVITVAQAVTAPATPKTAGSTVDLYRYTMKTATGTRFIHFYWDAYGIVVSPNGWPVQNGSITVSSIVLNGGLTNP